MSNYLIEAAVQFMGESEAEALHKFSSQNIELKDLQEGFKSFDHAKMDVGDLINHLAEHPATRDYIDHNAKYDGAHHLGRGVPVHHVAKALGIKPEHVEHAIKRIQDNTENYEGSAEVEGKHVTLHGGD